MYYTPISLSDLKGTRGNRMDPTGSGGNNTGGNNTGGDNMNTTGTDGGYRRIIYTGPFPYAPRNK